MNWLLAVLLKGFFAVAFFMVVWLIAAGLYKVIPDGKIKRALYSPLPGHRHRRGGAPGAVGE